MQLAFALPHMMRLKALTQPWEAAVTGADQTRMIRRADALGYEMLSIPEHFLIPRDHVELSGPHYFHATAAQGYVAGATQRMRINSCVTILPLHNPAILAKAIATIDWLSSGRMTATFGVGWLKREFELLGVPFHERGRIADEYLAAMIALWTEDWPCFEGKYVSFRDVAFEPKPVQKPHPPIWIGGDSDAALRRAARFGSGWHAAQTRPEDLPARIDFIKSQPSFGGGAFEVMCGLGSLRVGEGHIVNDAEAGPSIVAQELIDRLGAFRDLGVTISSVPIPPLAGVEAYLDFAQWVAEEVKPKV